MIIRQIEEKDLKDLCVLYEQFTNKRCFINPDLYLKLINNHHIMVFGAFDEGDILLGTITLLLIPNLIHGGIMFGQIENLVVDKEYRNRDIGSTLVKCVLDIAYKCCYKVILNCSDENVKFYEKCGFYKHENTMRINL